MQGSIFCKDSNLLDIPEEERLFRAGQIYFDKDLPNKGLELFDELLSKYPKSRFREQILVLKYLKTFIPEHLVFKYKFHVYLNEKTILGSKSVPKEIILTSKVLKELPEKMEVGFNNFIKTYPDSSMIPKFCYTLAKHYFLAEHEFPIDLSEHFNIRQIEGISLIEIWDPFKNTWIKNNKRNISTYKDYKNLYLDFFVPDKHSTNLQRAKALYKKIITGYPESPFWNDAVKELGMVLKIMEETEK